MTSYLRKYVTALASAKDYIAQWSSEHVFADEPLVVPFPTLAIFDPVNEVWSIHIKAWVYSPIQSHSIKNYLPSLPSFLTGTKNLQPTVEKKIDDISFEDNKVTLIGTTTKEPSPEKSEEKEKLQVDQEKKDVAAVVTDEIEREKIADSWLNEDEDKQCTGEEEDDIYEDALGEEINEQKENPGRLGLFFVNNSVKVTTKSVINGVEHLLQPSDDTGFIEERLEIANHVIEALCPASDPQVTDRKFKYAIQLNDPKHKYDDNDDDSKSFKCTIYVLAFHGVSVISDIDDTVKISNVLSKRLLLKHTFYSYFKPVEGMNELYQKWSDQHCQFHYVSASPWQLYPALSCFLESYRFPLGTMNLRKFSWSMEFFNPTDTYKLETISKIIDSYPLRKYICVGDSGELDPEVYSKLYILYPQAIAHIFIRDVCPGSTCLPNCEERYKKAFESVPKSRWTVFKNPKNIETNVNKLISV